jgi:ribosome-associated translation inhibitor RaiA
MATHVTGKTLDVGEALRSYVEKRVVLASSARRRVRIEKEHGEFRTNCTIDVARQPSQRTKNKKARKRR